MRTFRRLLASALLFGTLGLFSCVGEDFETAPEVEPNCAEDLFSCPSGLTCWIGGEPSALVVDCFNVGAGREGEACDLVLSSPTCGKNLFCAQFQGMASGSCRRLCEVDDPNRACPSGELCQRVTLQDIEITLCVPQG